MEKLTLEHLAKISERIRIDYAIEQLNDLLLQLPLLSESSDKILNKITELKNKRDGK